MVSKMFAAETEPSTDPDEAIKQYILSVVAKGTQTATVSTASAAAPTITSILKSRLNRK